MDNEYSSYSSTVEEEFNVADATGGLGGVTSLSIRAICDEVLTCGPHMRTKSAPTDAILPKNSYLHLYMRLIRTQQYGRSGDERPWQLARSKE